MERYELWMLILYVSTLHYCYPVTPPERMVTLAAASYRYMCCIWSVCRHEIYLSSALMRSEVHCGFWWWTLLPAQWVHMVRACLKHMDKWVLLSGKTNAKHMNVLQSLLNICPRVTCSRSGCIHLQTPTVEVNIYCTLPKGMTLSANVIYSSNNCAEWLVILQVCFKCNFSVQCCQQSIRNHGGWCVGVYSAVVSCCHGLSSLSFFYFFVAEDLSLL